MVRKRYWTKSALLVFATVPYVISLATGQKVQPSVTYAHDVAPILKAHCVSCHGGNAPDAKLDLSEGKKLMVGGRSGPIVVPGKAAGSLLLQKVKDAAKDRMPLDLPPLSAEDIATIETWINQGALMPVKNSSKHWAYVKPRRPAIPIVDSQWVRNPIDSFVLARLRKEELQPSATANRETLIRRVSLDLIGLPPTPIEVKAFLEDHHANAYEKVVDRLLASRHYGERQARGWLDLARFADSDGYEKDLNRSVWKYRDWVIGAFNQNLPYDQFTTEQLAGDLLKNPTLSQKIATGFQRNTMFNREGGVNQEEAHFLVVEDRAEVTASVWLGSTLNCARCHDHKYDPFTQKDYYAMVAFYNNTAIYPRGPKEIGEEKWFESQIPAPSASQASALSQRQLTAKASVETLGSLVTAKLPGWIKSERASANSMLPEDIQTAVRSLEPTTVQNSLLTSYFRDHAPVLAQARAEVRIQQHLLDNLMNSIPTSLVMEEKPVRNPLTEWVRTKGVFQSKSIQVSARPPIVLGQISAPKPSRLDLASWLVSRENPLTARVEVNRMWEQLFGKGIVETSEDFGTRCAPPTHPELLDWLASEFMDRKWDMKSMQKLMVTSATYMQDSDASIASVQRDPQNLWLSHGPRFRMEAEMIRDNALAASGLLNRKIGGPSVYPFQPAGVWDTPYNGEQWSTSKGDERYRRGIYTFMKRSSPYPSMVSLDATSRETCTVRRTRTNTPLQALALLNDEVMMDASKALGSKMLRAGTTTSERIAAGYNQCLARQPKAAELTVMKRLVNKLLKKYESQPATSKLLAETPLSATYTMVANVLLNLDETMTKE